jgi:hypothetical protein
MDQFDSDDLRLRATRIVEKLTLMMGSDAWAALHPVIANDRACTGYGLARALMKGWIRPTPNLAEPFAKIEMVLGIGHYNRGSDDGS